MRSTENVHLEKLRIQIALLNLPQLNLHTTPLLNTIHDSVQVPKQSTGCNLDHLFRMLHDPKSITLPSVAIAKVCPLALLDIAQIRLCV
jgi:hypothetical protein